MTLGTLKKHLAEMEEQGATDDSEVYILASEDYSHIEMIDYDCENDSINLISE